MKILMLTSDSGLMDGINRHIVNVAPSINSMDDYEVAVCTVSPRAELSIALESKGVKTYSLNASNGHDFRIFSSFIKVMVDFNPDIVHSHLMAFYEKILLSTFYRKKKYVLTVHGISDILEHEPFRIKLDRWLNSIFSIRYDAICYISKGVRQHLCGDKTQEGIYTVYNPIDFSHPSVKSHNLHKIIGVADETPIIGTSCRLARVKNPEMFTQVMCRVLQINESVHAVVIGDGAEDIKEQINSIVSNSSVQDRFHFLGYRQDAPELVADLSCFVLTSISEGMPTSILEVMARHTPFAMMEGNGGLKDIAEINELEGPIGVIVQKGDTETMATEISRIVEDESYGKKMADNAFRVGKKYFDIKSVTKQLIEVYQSVNN